jgi:uncharacterized protein (TIGR02145 family)
MKTKCFFFVMFVNIAANAQVTNVVPVGADYANKTVSFRVWWNAGSRDATHLAKVWVWIDYLTVNNNNTTSGNTWTRATVGTVSGGVISYDGSNRKGFWLEGNASTNYSATLTVQLTNVPDKFNWCAYVSDFPPNVTANNGTYTFKGTPPFTLIASNGTTSQTVTGATLITSALTITPTTIKDKTECPGGFCIYSGSDLYIDATHLCQQRTSGAQNWEAYIRDSRDSKLYRIVLMPDNKWWLAQNVKYASVGSAISGCTEDECGRAYTWAQVYAQYAGGSYGSSGNVQGICPPGWLLPIQNDFKTMTSGMGSNATICAYLRAPTAACTPQQDYYGWADKVGCSDNIRSGYCNNWYGNDNGHEDSFTIDCNSSGHAACNQILWATASNGGNTTVRCFRQL